MDELENLNFRERPDQRPHRQSGRSSTGPWLVVAVIAAILFVFAMRALLERTAWTAGSSPVAEKSQPAPLTSPSQPYVEEPVFRQREVPSVYRCVDRKGAVSFQSQPCGPNQRTTKVVAAPPDVEPIRPRQVITQARTRQGGYNTVRFKQQDALSARKAHCAIARRQREVTLEQLGLRRTYDLLQRLDEMVNSACKGL